MKRSLLIVCFYFFLISSFSIAKANEVNSDDNIISVITPVWDGWTNEDGSGFYFDLIKMIFKSQYYEINIAFSPFARAYRMVEQQKSDIMFSLYSRESNSSILTSHYPIDAGTVLVIFDRKLAWNGQPSLRDQEVIIPRGYNYHKHINVPFIKMDIVNSEQGMEMFLRERAPYFITHYEEMLKLIDIHNIDRKLYRTEVVYRKNLHMGFAKTDKGKKLKQIFDQKMPELIENDSIKGLYEKWNLEQFVNFNKKQLDNEKSAK